MGTKSYSSNSISSSISSIPFHIIQPIINSASVCNLSTQHVLKSDHQRWATIVIKPAAINCTTTISSYPAVIVSTAGV
jgi:hypothetical protein